MCNLNDDDPIKSLTIDKINLSRIVEFERNQFSLRNIDTMRRIVASCTSDYSLLCSLPISF